MPMASGVFCVRGVEGAEKSQLRVQVGRCGSEGSAAVKPW